MCGIAGIYGFSNDKLISDFSKRLAHRGPDGEGIYKDEQVTLLNRRLAIIDIRGGDQPIYNENQTIVTVYNGEIYNYRELRKELEDKGHRFSTLSDTEIIVHGYEEWGDQCFDKFNGMFGIALYDIYKQRLLLVRDHFGIKPLYFTLTKQGVMFASEITPLVYSGLIDRKPNEKVLYRYLRFRIHEDTPETFFEGVYKLMPGQMLILEKGKMKNKYYSSLEEELKNTQSSKSNSQTVSKDQIQIFKKQLESAIRSRLISEAPVGTCLSGGLDSSTVVAVVNKLLMENVVEAKSVGKVQNTFSAVFPGSSNDEECYIDAVLKNTQEVITHKVHPKPEEFFEDLEDFVKTQEEPTISTGPYAQYKVMQLAQGKVKVLLDGQGADEMMAGYLPYYFVYLRQLRKQKEYKKLFTEILFSLDVVSKYGYLKFKSLVGPFRSTVVFSKPFLKEFQSEKFHVVQDNLKLRLLQDVFYNSLPSLLRYEDKNSMRFSIEGRVPFLDTELIRTIFSLPDEAIIKNGWNKNILRKAVADLLPPSIVKRRNKIGFTTPEEEWFLRMKNRIYSLFLTESFAKRPYFNQAEVLKAFQRFIEGKTNDTLLFWRLLNVELWMREFFDTKQESHRMKHETQKQSSLIDAQGNDYERLLIKTDIFQKGDDYVQKIGKHVFNVLKNPKSKIQNSKWFVVVSEKVVAISQGRSHFIWDIKPSFWAKQLSRFVTRTPYGIGLGSPWTMQLAIDEIGLPKIAAATIVSALTKPFGIRGMFYRIAGSQVRSIDGPTEYSLYPSNVSAKLGPKDPEKVVQDISQYIRDNLKISAEKNFLGAVVIDANDLGRNVLGNSTGLSDSLVEEIFRDNPMGQGAEQTPISLVIMRP